jgi:hypothetical protein
MENLFTKLFNKHFNFLLKNNYINNHSELVDTLLNNFILDHDIIIKKTNYSFFFDIINPFLVSKIVHLENEVIDNLSLSVYRFIKDISKENNKKIILVQSKLMNF